MAWPELPTSGAMPTMTHLRLDPAHILGCSLEEATQLFHGRPVTPGEAEAIAERAYDWRRHRKDAASYWVTVAQAAAILGMSPSGVRHLLDRHRLPFVQHVTGARLMRRRQVEALKATYGGRVDASTVPAQRSPEA